MGVSLSSLHAVGCLRHSCFVIPSSLGVSSFVILSCLAVVDIASATQSFKQALPIHRRQTPHPAVARVVVPERGGTSYGSGTLVDVNRDYGLVVTNWHVVRDAAGEVTVVFPDGFRSAARPLKVDADWDLAALVIWRPKSEPITIAARAPQPGDILTIAGYGRGSYRSATGRCTQYVAPGLRHPYEMVEVSVAARQGDSGGPIFNTQGELAGVLFGSGFGTTSGSYCGRVQGFLASLAPGLMQGDAPAVAKSDPVGKPRGLTGVTAGRTSTPGSGRQVLAQASGLYKSADCPKSVKKSTDSAAKTASPRQISPGETQVRGDTLTWHDVAGTTVFEQTKTLLAMLGGFALLTQAMRMTCR